MISNETALRECPFCGGEASGDGLVNYSEHVAEEQDWGQCTFYYANCMHCGANNKGIRGHVSKAEAVAAWNNRIARTPADGPDEPGQKMPKLDSDGPADAVSEAEVEAALGAWRAAPGLGINKAIIRICLEAAQRARK